MLGFLEGNDRDLRTRTSEPIQQLSDSIGDFASHIGLVTVVADFGRDVSNQYDHVR